jgi:predicted ester cyclase
MSAQKYKQVFMVMAVTIIALLAPSTWANDQLPKPENLQIASGLSKQEIESLLNTAQQYYAFWNTGIEVYAKRALAADFIDLNLPKGRPQGPNGPIIASAAFRQAVPDLSVAVKSVYLLKNKVITQLLFTGHFTGTFGKIKGESQTVTFSAVDIYTIQNGKITENWHLEDNLSLMQQLGLVNHD